MDSDEPKSRYFENYEIWLILAQMMGVPAKHISNRSPKIAFMYNMFSLLTLQGVGDIMPPKSYIVKPLIKGHTYGRAWIV